jgi:formylglycine-generating enzyme required for sulfatase activity
MLRSLLLSSLLAAGCVGSDPALGDGASKDSGDVPQATPGDTVEVPAGPFPMGCDTAAHPECNGDEAPVHEVDLTGFRIEVTEVTFGLWQECMDSFACPEPTGGMGPADEPVVDVEVVDALNYCDWRGRRLPTEAEWEKAARGTDGRLYPWGDEAPDCDRAASRPCDGGTVTVATHPDGVSPYGAWDMAGNAWEWVQDFYDAHYYETSPGSDPVGGAPGGLRVVRGVDGWSSTTLLRATNREMAIPNGVSIAVGFRCVEDL